MRIPSTSKKKCLVGRSASPCRWKPNLEEKVLWGSSSVGRFGRLPRQDFVWKVADCLLRRRRAQREGGIGLMIAEDLANTTFVALGPWQQASASRPVDERRPLAAAVALRI